MFNELRAVLLALHHRYPRAFLRFAVQLNRVVCGIEADRVGLEHGRYLRMSPATATLVMPAQRHDEVPGGSLGGT